MYQRFDDFIHGWTNSFRKGHDLQKLVTHHQALQQCFRIILFVSQGKEKNIVNKNGDCDKENGDTDHNFSLPKQAFPCPLHTFCVRILIKIFL